MNIKKVFIGGLGEGGVDGNRFSPKWATPSLGGPRTDTELTRSGFECLCCCLQDLLGFGGEGRKVKSKSKRYWETGLER